MALALLMAVVAVSGLASGDGVSKVAGLAGFMLFLWPVLFLVMIPIRLRARLNQKAATFGASIGRQAVTTPKKNAAQAIK